MRASSGPLSLEQPARGVGYRVNADAFLLARFARQKQRVPHVCDLGAGVGAVGLTLLHEGAATRATLVEIDEAAASLARANAAANGLAAHTNVIVGDVLDVARKERGRASLVVCNPPYFAPGRGRTPAVAARARARFGDLDRFVEAARLIAGRRAKCVFVYPATELARLLETLRRYGLEPKRMSYVFADARSPARVVLVQAQAAKPGGLVVEPPIFDA